MRDEKRMVKTVKRRRQKSQEGTKRIENDGEALIKILKIEQKRVFINIIY